jgi:phosphoribosylformimino-5-aminoimidazole carboxamide ribotide isomerase
LAGQPESRTEIEVIPAVDLKGGRCVSLYKGDYSQETVFTGDPVEIALKWQAKGAPRLHIVDLDGAASGDIANISIITEIAGALLIPTQVGGGIRNIDTVEKLLRAGVERVIISTAAVENPSFVKEAGKRFPESVVIALDARDGKIATHGWQKETDIAAVDFARSMVRLGVKRFIYTDVNRNATLTEPNFTAIFELVQALKLPVIASGGISTLAHLKMLRKIGVEGAVVGKALYTGNIEYKLALDELSKKEI